MGKLIYSAITSLDGYVADQDGNFDWAEPDEEVHTFVNDLERTVGTYLYGRRMYEVIAFWETALALADLPTFIRDYAGIWQAADRIVYSKTLEVVSSARTRIEPNFDPEAVWQMKSGAEGGRPPRGGEPGLSLLDVGRSSLPRRLGRLRRRPGPVGLRLGGGIPSAGDPRPDGQRPRSSAPPSAKRR
jgi:RibD C-terminal domain